MHSSSRIINSQTPITNIKFTILKDAKEITFRIKTNTVNENLPKKERFFL